MALALGCLLGKLLKGKGLEGLEEDKVHTCGGPRRRPGLMENHNFQWVNPLFQWPFSIAMLNYQRVISRLSWIVGFGSHPTSGIPALPASQELCRRPWPWLQSQRRTDNNVVPIGGDQGFRV